MSDSSVELATYRAWLQERIINSVRSGARGLHEIVAATAGADPAAVRDVLKSAISSGRLEQTASTLADTSIESEKDDVVEPLLPLAHPLDFDWRFSRRGAARLLSKASEQGKVDLCFIASTTVALLAASCGWPGRLLAIDANGSLLESASRLHPQIDTARLDVTHDALPQVRAKAVIADPPWYPEHLHSFLWASARLCVAGGYVLLSMPGEGTRPDIAAERASALKAAALYGLEVVEIETQTIRYETPLFERNALRAAGVSLPIRFWRRGDLVVFRRTFMPEGDRPVPPPRDGEWTEFTSVGTRIRFQRAARSSSCFPQLRSIISGDILPTVSRRDPRRAEANVWTSGNRVYACESPAVLHVIAEAAACGSSSAEAVEAFLGRGLRAHEAQSVLEALDQIAKLIFVEREEQAAYARELSENEIDAS